MAQINQPPRGGPYNSLPFCGCWVPIEGQHGRASKKFLPLVDLNSHTTILSSSTRTVLRQTFKNEKPEKLNEVQYTFPLFDGVSVVGFTCKVESVTLVGVVKEKQQARVEYKEALARGETATLLEQLADASDVFSTKVGNVPAGEKVEIEITYLGELLHDSEVDGAKLVIPTAIAPRYGSTSFDSSQVLASSNAPANSAITISVDVLLEQASTIRQIQSPSHALSLTMGRTLDMAEETFQPNCASASLALGTTHLEKDFIFVLSSKEQGVPQALLESHPTIPNQRAVMATLVPKFNLPPITPEIVFVVDRSGSMSGKIETLVSALRVFLKSLPVNGIKFNICSFGSHYSFLFEKSKTYDQTSLNEAMQHLQTFDSNFGGTEMFQPIRKTCQQRLKDVPLAVMVLTDGQIWDQQKLFDFINKQENARFFSLGIGAGASSALVQGIARAGGGFAQFVAEQEKMDKKIVRMLKGALTPHIDYSLEVQYEKNLDGDFEVIEPAKPSQNVAIQSVHEKKPISLFDANAEELPTNPPAGRYDALPDVPLPKVIQAPHKIPALYPFDRTTAYILLDPNTDATPTSIKLSGTSEVGPVELTIPIQDIGTGSTIHQLAAKKAIQELEEGRGWLTTAKDGAGKSLKDAYEGRWDLIVERECVRLGTEYGVAGKFTSFVAVKKRDGAADHQDEQRLGQAGNIDQSEEEYGGVYHAHPMPDMKRIRGGGSSGLPAACMPPGSGGLFSAARMLSSPIGASNLVTPAASVGARGGGSIEAFAPRRAPVEGAKRGGFGGTGAAPRSRQGNPFAEMRSTATTTNYAARSIVPTHADPTSQFNLDFSTLDNTSAGENFDFDSFLGNTKNENIHTEKNSKNTYHSLDDEQRMHAIIGLQCFEGNWAANDMWKILSVDKPRLAQEYPDMAESTLVTVAAVVWLQEKMQGEVEVWEMVVEKALAWLRNHGKVDDLDAKLAVARKLVK